MELLALRCTKTIVDSLDEYGKARVLFLKNLVRRLGNTLLVCISTKEDSCDALIWVIIKLFY